MRNIMVCVTKQKTCERLIDYGKNLACEDGSQLFVIHVLGEHEQILGNEEEGEALEFLYEKAKNAGASLTVEKSDNILQALEKLVIKNQINEVVVGESGEEKAVNGFLDSFKKKLVGKAKLTVVPSNL